MHVSASGMNDRSISYLACCQSHVALQVALALCGTLGYPLCCHLSKSKLSHSGIWHARVRFGRTLFGRRTTFVEKPIRSAETCMLFQPHAGPCFRLVPREFIVIELCAWKKLKLPCVKSSMNARWIIRRADSVQGTRGPRYVGHASQARMRQ